MKNWNYYKLILVVCVLPMLLLNGSVSQAAGPTCRGWSVVKSPSPGGNTGLMGVAAVTASDVWAVGTSGQALIEQWNGRLWSEVKNSSPGSGSILSSVAAVAATDVWAVGDYYENNVTRTLVEHWNGKQWSEVKSPNPAGSTDSELSSVAVVSANDVWAVGRYGHGNAVYQTLMEHWNGTQWSEVKSPNPSVNDSLGGVTAVSARDVWAVGTSGNFSSATLTLIEHWNGTQWSVVKSPNPGANDSLSGVAAVTANDVWVVGSYSSNSPLQTLVENWNGTRWSVVPSPNPSGSYGSDLSEVAVVSASDIWAVGNYAYTPGGPHFQTLTERWNGTRWSAVKSPHPYEYSGLFGVAAVSATDVWAVGYYGSLGGSGTLIARYHC